MMKETPLEELAARLLKNPDGSRRIVAIAGAPGSGKSTMAKRLVKTLNQVDSGHAALLEMDGYHYDDRVLAIWGLQDHKGAPDTFDVDGLAHMLVRLRETTREHVAVPVFDRSIEIARAGAGLIAGSCQVIVVEGNYLLLDQSPWNALAPAFDITVMIATPEDVLRKRLMARWDGLGLSPQEAARKVDKNDLPNGRFVMENSIKADFTLAI